MDSTNQTDRIAGGADAGLSEIEAIIGRARSGDLSQEGAFAAIARVVGQRTDRDPAETYQKPLG